MYFVHVHEIGTKKPLLEFENRKNGNMGKTTIIVVFPDTTIVSAFSIFSRKNAILLGNLMLNTNIICGIFSMCTFLFHMYMTGLNPLLLIVSTQKDPENCYVV